MAAMSGRGRTSPRSGVGRGGHWVVMLALLTVHLVCAADINLAGIDAGDSISYAGDAFFYEMRYDECGVCMGDNKTCTDCAGDVFKPLLGERAASELDPCGVCKTVAKISRDLADIARGLPDILPCMDCAGEINGTKVLDVCDQCLEPTDPAFGNSCLGCDGVPKSGYRLNICGACVPQGRVNRPCEEPDNCCDCLGVPYGSSAVSVCCECTDPAVTPPTLNMTVALALFAEAEVYYENATSSYAALELAKAGEETWPRNPNILVNLETSKQLVVEAWALLYLPSANDNSTCYEEIFINGTRDNPRDVCGRCLGANATCMGCSPTGLDGDARPIPVGGVLYDDCGVCGGNNKDVDECGICFGDNSTCVGCDGVPNSGKVEDGCGECTFPEEFEQDCAAGKSCCGCDGVALSGLVFDDCGKCVDPSGPNAEAVVNATCRGCDGVPNSGHTFDFCCDCYDPTDAGGGTSDGNETVAAAATMASPCFKELFDFIPGADIAVILALRAASAVVDPTKSPPPPSPLSPSPPPPPRAGQPPTPPSDNSTGGPSPEQLLALQYYDAEGKVNFTLLPELKSFPTSERDIPIEGGILRKNAVWDNTYTECGECRRWGYAGGLRVPCAGCNPNAQGRKPFDSGPGQAFSGMHYDECGVCGGDCACNPECANATHCIVWQVPGDADLQSAQAVLPGGDGPYKNGCVRPEMIGRNSKNDLSSSPWLSNILADIVLCPEPVGENSFYQRLNLPPAAVTAWYDLARSECRPWYRPPPPPDPRDAPEWVVLFNGRESRPYSIKDLERGFIEIVDPLTGELVDLPLTPETLIAKITNVDDPRTLSYGQTSRDATRVEEINEKYLFLQPLLDSASLTSDVAVDNNMVVINQVTILRNNSFFPMGEIEGLVGVTYPFCTGSTWRGQEHRLHGKKSGGNFLGLITTKNITELDGARDRPWNPDREYIYDTATSWHDQQCICQEEWYFNQNRPGLSEGVPPTCERTWVLAEQWIDGGYRGGPKPGIYGGKTLVHKTLAGREYVVQEGGTQVYPGGPYAHVGEDGAYTLRSARSLAQSPWKVQGGWFAQDFGGDVNKRGPWRKDAHGRLTLSTVSTVLDLERDRCYKAARLLEPRRNASGAAWYSGGKIPVTSAWEVRVEFFISDRAQQCDDVAQVGRSFSEETRTAMHRTCRVGGADGFALVIMDADDAEGPAASDLAGVFGDAGGGLGYTGLRHSLAVEVDTWHNPDNHEPFERHVAVHTAGSGPNSAHHSSRLGATTEIPDVTDGAPHTLRVAYDPAPSLEAQIEMVEGGALQGTSADMLVNFVGGGASGLLTVYVDDSAAPGLTVPLSMPTVLRAGSTLGWVGLTASTGESWQMVDITSWNITHSGL
mmetsp:Transcript_42437/g.135994  ORF Transcript_42437/g.135994 Transcript_42437/m.135994 type:complete len:1370 (+) Transcript_42437:74-4183(+)